MIGRQRAAIAVLAIAAVILAGVIFHRQIERGIVAALMLGDLGAGAKSSLFKSLTPAPERAAISYQSGNRNHSGDLYKPGKKPLAVIVLVPGALATGKDDPRLIAFAETLARARFEILVPDIPNVRALELRASDAVDVADAVSFANRLEELSGLPLGIVALSYAAGPAILAALDPAIGGKVAFILAVGGYYDADAVLTFFTTGFYWDPPGGPWRQRVPNAYGKWLFVAGNVGLVGDRRDGDVLARVAARKLDDLSADTSSLAAQLGPEGRATYEFVTNVDPGRAAALIAALPPAVRAQIDALDLKRRDLSRLHPGLILVHGRDDAIIPESESVALAAAAPADRAKLYMIEHLSHVDLGPVGIGDAATLWRALCALLKERAEGG